MSDAASPRRVFISYSWDSPEHIEWVVSLATRLVQNGIDVLIDQWNTRLGADLPAFMESGLTNADRILVVSSDEYVRKANGLLGGAGYEKIVMTAQMMTDLIGDRVVPVIRNNTGAATVPTFLSGRKYVDFRNDADFEDKYSELIHDLYGRTLRPRPPLGRSPFDQGIEASTPSLQAERRGAVSPAAQQAWQSLASTPAMTWRGEVFSHESGYFSSSTRVEIELVPIEPLRVEVRRLQALEDELASIGRQAGFFTSAQALHAHSTANEAWVRVQNDPNWAENGLLVTRAGQRGFWLTLPRDDMGSIFDPVDLAPKIAHGLQLLDQLPIYSPQRYAVGIGMGPLGMITTGSVSDLGRRSSVSMAGFGQKDIQLAPEDSISASRLSVDAESTAEEIVARLAANFRA